MTTALTDRDILPELEPFAERQLEDHLRKAKAWNPHDYVPWDDGAAARRTERSAAAG
ncbi:acyl-ACP desaturase [Nocardia cyriacigeorgica]|uniref:acyl-ACP desaturase n=1 Tax=Nocardia cyriacigeorgica TaxID=135487 RepID=UPI0026C5CC3E